VALKRGDPLGCFKLDRLGHSLAHVVSVIEDLDARGVHFMTAEVGLSTKGNTGKLVLNILGSIALFERNLMLERTRAGLAAARAKGRIGGQRRRGHQSPADAEQGRTQCRRCGQHAQGQSTHSVQGAACRARPRGPFRELKAAAARYSSVNRPQSSSGSPRSLNPSSGRRRRQRPGQQRRSRHQGAPVTSGCSMDRPVPLADVSKCSMPACDG